ncbi:MAG: response regulator [Magnetococcales bacterium]|nr:response regulator [Magnetococcales bacterium]
MNDSKPRILIVDDVRLNLKILNDILCNDYLIKVATHGEQALERAASDPKPDMILLDIQMPGMGGYEVCSRLKSNPVTRDIPVIFITNLTDEEEEGQGLALGAVDYIFKPLRPSIIQARVRTHMGLRQVQSSLSERNVELERLLTLRDTIEQLSRHDLKGPLNSILGAAEVLLEDDDLRPEQQNLLTMLERSGYSMLEMINRSLDMLKMEQGTYVLESKPVDLLKLMHRITEETRYKWIQVSLQGDSVVHGSTLMVRGEELLCYSMLSNLIKNAVEASPRGETVTIDLEVSGQAIVRINNRGMVPEEIRCRFFEKYITQGKRFGTGLGTYSARLITQTLGGSIQMETSQEKGTTITVALPLFDGDSVLTPPAVHNEITVAVEPQSAVTTAASHGMSVLLIDPGEITRGAVQACLLDTPHALAVVLPGHQALPRFKEGGFQLVLAAMGPAHADGWNIITEMRDWEYKLNRPPIPILALLEANSKQGIERSRLAGCNLHLAMPLQKKRLLDVLSLFGVL